MPWWGILITVVVGLIILASLVAVVIAFRTWRRVAEPVMDEVHGSLWGAEFENRPRDPYHRLPRPQSRFDQR